MVFDQENLFCFLFTISAVINTKLIFFLSIVITHFTWGSSHKVALVLQLLLWEPGDGCNSDSIRQNVFHSLSRIWHYSQIICKLPHMQILFFKNINWIITHPLFCNLFISLYKQLVPSMSVYKELTHSFFCFIFMKELLKCFPIWSNVVINKLW